MVHPAQVAPGGLGEIAAALDGDPEAIFRFVADEVRYEPYGGMLRGAQGTLASRAGDSVDQAVLLAELLESAGIPSRFAVGPIGASAAAEMLASSDADEATLREHEARALFGRSPVDPGRAPRLPSMRSLVPDGGAGSVEDRRRWAGEDLTDTLSLIEAALLEAGLAIEHGFTGVSLDELSQHTWIQASIEGAWGDLDPSLPGISVGAALGQPAGTRDAIPVERTHMIELALIAECVEDGELATIEQARVIGTAAELSDASVALTNIGSDAVPELTRRFEQVLGLVT